MGQTVAVNCARLGLATSFATRVPGDLLGLGLVLELVDEGVDISLSRIDPDARTTVCIIKNWASEQPEYICGCSKESGGQPPVLTELSDDVVTLCSKARTIYLGEGVCRFYEELLGRIDTENKVVIYRPSFMSLELFWDECSKVLRHNPILLLNERKLGILQRKGVDFPGDLMGLGVDRIIVTKGSRGTTLYTQGKVVDIPAEHRAVVDTVGAGDVFSAALIYRLVKGDDIEAAARYATKLASQSISVLGPRKLAKP
uniref:Carbohydrate kinase PfkB domain-containing protein n=1 Tax=Ignisphaera aggregans TaxID=334771 RepID=A0A7C2V9G5_9CREN